MKDFKRLTPDELATLSLLCDELLNCVDTMDIKDLKENYKFMINIPLFSHKHIPYMEDKIDLLTEENKKEFVSYFKSGLNMLKINLNNYDTVASFDNFDKPFIDQLTSWVDNVGNN